jgi:hypothetical protein
MRHFTRDGFQRSRPRVPSADEMQSFADELAERRCGNGHAHQQQASSGSDAADLAQMNATYAVTKIGGKTRVMSLEESSLFPGCKVPVFSTVPDFCAFHLKQKKPKHDGRGKIGIGRWWIEHPDRRQYDGVVYDPASKNPSMFNLWRGFSCQPIEGNCDFYIEHLRDNICNGRQDEYEYLVNWMAYAVQYPGRQGEVAVVMRGAEGTGKGIAIKLFGSLFGPHFRHIVHAKHLVGHFNAHLQQCSLLFADEAFFAGDRAHESILKGLITEETLLIEPKGVDPFPVRNCIHLMMSSNADWVIPAGADARRFFMLNASAARKQDRQYFGKIVHQMETGGREALLYLLLHRDLSAFNVGAVPQTDALATQKAFTRRGIDRLIEQICHDGILPSAHTIHPNIAVTTGEDERTGFYYSVRIANRLKEWGCEPWKSGNQRGIRFPALADLRLRFDRKHGLQGWPASEGQEPDWEAPGVP